MKSVYGFFISVWAIWFLTGCGESVVPEQPEVKGNQYTLEECKEELLEAEDFSQDGSIDKIVVVKKERKMYLYKDNKVTNTLPVSLGQNPVGTKQQEGDNRTPEGEFWISRKLCSPKYYRSLCISYPRPEDRASAAKRGVRPGGAITLHGQPTWNADGKGDAYTLSKNWTQGCVAVTNSAMRELWYAVREGVPIVIQ
ncbi:MAG TPA: L,D-transpeptidase family protein [Sulfurovum sp.]|nr:L,D-transpeptidase family protein [Sulfurovum sp.]